METFCLSPARSRDNSVLFTLLAWLIIRQFIRLKTSAIRLAASSELSSKQKACPHGILAGLLRRCYGNPAPKGIEFLT